VRVHDAAITRDELPGERLQPIVKLSRLFAFTSRRIRLRQVHRREPVVTGCQT